MKLETLQEMEYPLPVPLRSPPASQQMGGTLQPPPRELTADQVKPLDMAKASLALRPQVIHRVLMSLFHLIINPKPYAPRAVDGVRGIRRRFAVKDAAGGGRIAYPK